MSDPTTKLQVNFRVGDVLINAYAQSEAELAFQLQSLAKLAGEIAETDSLLKAANTVASSPPGSSQNGGTYAAPSTVTYRDPYQGQSSSGPGPAPTCRHGEMRYKSGVSSKNGRPYQGWTCPSNNRQDQCPAQWIND